MFKSFSKTFITARRGAITNRCIASFICRPYSEHKGSKTHQNLVSAFANACMANARYTYFAQKADVEGDMEAAALFRSVANGEATQSLGILEWLEELGDPVTNMEMGDTLKNLESAVAGETNEHTNMYPGMANDARNEGFEDVAEWFEALARAQESHAMRFQEELDSLQEREEEEGAEE